MPRRAPRSSRNAAPATMWAPTPRTRSAPLLNGIVGRKAGTIEGFAYSDANKAAGAKGLVWTEDVLLKYLENPLTFMQGTKMAFAGPEGRAGPQGLDRLSSRNSRKIVAACAPGRRMPRSHASIGPGSATGRPRVGLFVTCLVDLFRPSVGFAAVKLLTDAGCEVDVPDGADLLRPARLQLRRQGDGAARLRA